MVLLVIAVLVGGVMSPSTPASANDAGQQIEQSVQVVECRATYRHQTGVDAAGKPVFVWRNMTFANFCYSIYYDRYGTPWYIDGPVKMVRYERIVLPAATRTP